MNLLTGRRAAYNERGQGHFRPASGPICLKPKGAALRTSRKTNYGNEGGGKFASPNIAMRKLQKFSCGGTERSPFFSPRRGGWRLRRLYVLTFAVLFFCAITAAVRGEERGSEERAPQKEVHLTVWYLPRPEDTGIGAKCMRAIIREFQRKYPYIRLSSPTGIQIPEMSAMDTGPLMAIAGGVSPDVIYVNFRQSDTYIKEGFLYPLDEWFEKLPKEEQEKRLLPQVKKVVYRWGPGKETGEDPNKHYWALPYANLCKALLWRKDLFQKVGLDPERPPKDWQEYYEFAKRCTDPDKGTYGILWGKGSDWSWYFYSILCSAGARAMQDFGEDDWHVTFNSPEAVTAYEFMLRLVQGKFRKADGRIVEGVVYRDATEGERLWEDGRIGMRETYLQDDLLVNINPELVGIAPVPVGPQGKRAAELNCTMCGIFSGAAKKGRDVLEAAWKYVYFLGSPEAYEIKTRVLVENGFGMFANPEYLEKLGYYDYLRRIPKGWREAFKEAMRTGEPEPYGRNTQMVYKYMTDPADQMLLEKLGQKVLDEVEKARENIRRANPHISQEDLEKELEKVREKTSLQVRKRIKEILDYYAGIAEQKMIGVIPPKEMLKRRIVALIVALCIVAGFAGLFAYIVKVFTPPESKGGWLFRRYWLAYLLLLPAVGAIALWQYVPMVRGAIIAFQDYHFVRPTDWAGLDNFANVLWDSQFWNALKVSGYYAFFSIVMGFFAPIVLAILLHEIPKGKILFRTIYYLPAVVSGLVVMLMWKTFFEPSERGLLNQVITGIPPWGFPLVAGVASILLALGAYWHYKKGARIGSSVLMAAAILIALAGYALYRVVSHLPDQALPAQKWLEDPKWALICVILPTVWAGIGPGCLIYLAALKTIPEDFYEAADLDGAGFFSKLWHITIPNIKILIVINFIGAVVGAFRVAEYILVMTGGGPNHATEVLALKIFYDAFVFLKFGTATAMAWIMGSLLIGFTIFQLRRLSRVEFRTAGGL